MSFIKKIACILTHPPLVKGHALHYDPATKIMTHIFRCPTCKRGKWI